jgi:hypothetical protein
MARGWESKSVEDQISARETDSQERSLPRHTPEELQRRARRESLQMVRTRTLTSLQATCDSRYRAHLERVLADLDAQLLALDPAANPQS